MSAQPSYDLLGIAVIIATIASPLIALWATVIYQRRDRSYQLRLSVFLDLMRHRRKSLSPEYVNSLNLVPVIFHDKPHIVAAFKEVMLDYESNDWTLGRQSPSWPDIQQRLIQSLQKKTAVLLSSMAEDVRVKVDQLTILQGAYLPEQWHLEEVMESETKQLLRSFLRQERPFQVLAQIQPSSHDETNEPDNQK